ncbi:MAG: NAD(P)H-hydrate epimerase [Bacteroidales bacterium]|nr:NAD(P)H-hydrate epimerase [Bacteroidales bacterium]
MIPHFTGTIPFVDEAQLQELDRLMTDTYGFNQVQIMENAGLNLAILAREIFLTNDPHHKKVLVVAGSGSNGGGVMVAARRLKNWGADVSLMLTTTRGKFRKETIYQFSILKNMGVQVVDEIPENCDLIIEGMSGIDHKPDSNTKTSKFIDMINESGMQVLSLDAPAGINLTTGKPDESTIKANCTMTLGLAKLGLFKLVASKYIGELYLADISIPKDLLDQMGIQVNGLSKAFAENTVVKINKVVVFNS